MSGSTFADAGKYNTQYSYDKNGNIETLSRMGQLGGSNSYDFIDNLTYSYSGNQLKYVNDLDNHDGDHQDNGFSDNGSFLTTNEYFYDLNGNLTQDLNKQINDIDYNHLNLPQHIAIGTSAFNIIDYIYTADGVKRQKSIAGSGARSAPTDYLGSIVYPGDADAFIFTSEGRALRNDNGVFDYEYFLKDHLGNTRVSFNQKGIILQDNSYYPFGMDMGETLSYVDNTASENKYLYNGKEMQDDFGLGWYDYGARYYDAELGRWHVVDPLTEKYYEWSAYNYVLNNPINFMDPNGAWVDGYKNLDWEYKWFDNETADIISSENRIWMNVADNRTAFDLQRFGTLSNSTEPNDQIPIMPVKDNPVRKMENWLNSSNNDSNIESLAKFGGRYLYSIADGLTVFATNFTLVQDLTGLDGAINLNGTTTTPKESFEKGLDGFMTTFGGIINSEKQLLQSAPKYSSYANRNQWSRSVSADKKHFLRNQINNSAIENKLAIKQSGFFERAISFIQFYLNQE